MNSSDLTVIAVAPNCWQLSALEDVLAAAQRVGASAQAQFGCLLLGHSNPDHERLALQAGACTVWTLDPGGADTGDCELFAAAALSALADDQLCTTARRVVLAPPGAAGEELCARIAAGNDSVAAGRCEDIRVLEGQLQFDREGWGGRLTMSLVTAANELCACLRAGKPSYPGTQVEGRLVPLERVMEQPRQRQIEYRETSETLPPIESVKTLVCGGRGVNQAGFVLLERLAEALGASLAGSLPAVDAGMVPAYRQVGVSGKFVRPDLYFAVGISGTPQHLAGISPETRIVALNKDPEAPIFRVADIGVVNDWETVLPALLEALSPA